MTMSSMVGSDLRSKVYYRIEACNNALLELDSKVKTRRESGGYRAEDNGQVVDAHFVLVAKRGNPEK